MTDNKFELELVSISQLCLNNESCIYEIPIYQRNYAWGRDEIRTLIQDIYDAYENERPRYYVGTLVTFLKDKNVYEVIDGQQRLTSIIIILNAMGTDVLEINELRYKARKHSDSALKNMPDFEKNDDYSIKSGYEFAKEKYDELFSEKAEKVKKNFYDYFLNNVQIIRYTVPGDIDLNHYFEIMNSRGEQLEPHEIVKSWMLKELTNDDDRAAFNSIWESCSDLGGYIQQRKGIKDLFAKNCARFEYSNFEEVANLLKNKSVENSNMDSLKNMINSAENNSDEGNSNEEQESFQPLIDFSNFLLIVLKITLMLDEKTDISSISLDDKDLLDQFKNKSIDSKIFAFNLLKARFLLDNYMIHHSKGEGVNENNPWHLERLEISDKQKFPKNLCPRDTNVQEKLVQLLSMFEVSFTARQRKNYLFYCLLYLMQKPQEDFDNNEQFVIEYKDFVRKLAQKYFFEVYMGDETRGSKNVPIPGSFDKVILSGNRITNEEIIKKEAHEFNRIFGDVDNASPGIPAFVFNYLDYLLWEKYYDKLNGENPSEKDKLMFFNELGLDGKVDNLNVFKNFYFSRTRTSLEHFYPQATAKDKEGYHSIINCLGNYAMIGNEANSAGSNWDPASKVNIYLGDNSGKIRKKSVASLKFILMLNICKKCDNWDKGEIKNHQDKMIEVLINS